MSLATPPTPPSAPGPGGDIATAREFAYPEQVIYLIASLIALVSIYHAVSLLYRYTTRRRVPSAYRRGQISWRRLPAALLDTLRALAFRWTVPIGSSYNLNLTEVGLTIGYIGVLLTWTFINTTSATGVNLDPDYYANRAGMMAATQIPVVTALGMRNNLISWLTGVSFDKLNYLHRTSARVIVILVWVHAGGNIVGVGLKANDTMNNQWVQCGVLAASTLTLLCVLTVRPVRQRNYEIFLPTHFVFVFIFMLAVYFHLSGSELAYHGAWPSMIIWGLDRLLRLLRLAVFNFGYLNPWSTNSKSLDASIQVLSPSFLRISLSRPNRFHWRPGQSAYLSFPTVSSFIFESHPFTIATIDTDHDTDDASPLSGKKLVFLLRVRNGFTKKLMAKASEDQTYKVFVNGPYSSPPILIGYQTVIFIAAGSGITFPLPLMLGLIQRAKRDGACSQRVVFVWVIREPEQINGITDILSAALENIPPQLSLEIQINITSTVSETRDSAKNWDDESSQDHPGSPGEEKPGVSVGSAEKPPFYRNVFNSPFVKMEQGRPNVQALISKEIAKATGSISINVCGTHGLGEAVRKATRYPRPVDILRGGPTVSLHIEAFGG